MVFGEIQCKYLAQALMSFNCGIKVNIKASLGENTKSRTRLRLDNK